MWPFCKNRDEDIDHLKRVNAALRARNAEITDDNIRLIHENSILKDNYVLVYNELSICKLQRNLPRH